MFLLRFLLFFTTKQLSNFLNVQHQTSGRRHCQWIKSCQISVISRRSNMLQTHSSVKGRRDPGHILMSYGTERPAHLNSTDWLTVDSSARDVQGTWTGMWDMGCYGTGTGTANGGTPTLDSSQAVWQGNVVAAVAIKINDQHLTIKAKQSVAPYRHRGANEMGGTTRQLVEEGLEVRSSG